jgi:Tol biopolymer transport system component
VRVVNNQPQVSIEIIDTSTSLAKSAYVNAGGGLVAQGAPHYLYWSPDSSYLAFIAATGEGLTLFLDEVESEEPPVAVESGAPLYFHWAADSSALLIHRGPEIMLAQRPFREPPRPLLTSNVPFRVPALSPRGTQFAYFGDTGTGRSLLVSPVASPGDASKLLDVGGLAALAWSPNGEELAVADQRSAGGAVFDRLQIISTATGLARTVGEGPIFAFFWSPQGDKIAWVSLNTRNRTFEWMASGVSGEEPQPLFGFQPSSDTLTMLGFFDQYAYSHSPWSPDGSRLVVAGTMQPTFGRQNGHTPTGDRVFVLDTNGGQTPQEIATGTLAVWSWN